MNRQDAADALFDGQNWDHEPGCAAAILEKGKVSWTGCFGKARIADSIAIDEDTRFRIASITKPMLALVIAALEDRGLLSFNDRASKFLPELHVPKSPTISQLLSMKSGIREAFQLDGIALGHGTSHAMASRQQLALLLAQTGQNFAPGTRTLYCNSNSILLQLIAERVTCMSLGMLLEEIVFRPAAMTSAILAGGLAHRLAGTAIAYGRKSEGFTVADPDMVALAPGGVIASLRDIIAFWQWLRTNPLNWRTRLAGPVYHADGSESNYAHGFGKYRISGNLALGHSGGHGGWSCDTMWLPETDIAVVVLGNRADINHYERARELVVTWTGIAPDPGCTPRLASPVEPPRQWEETYGSSRDGFVIRITGSTQEINIEGRRLPRQADGTYRRILGVEPVTFRFNDDRSVLRRTEGNYEMLLERANPASCPAASIITGTYSAPEMPQPLIVHLDKDGRLRLAMGACWPSGERLFLEAVRDGLYRCADDNGQSADLNLVFQLGADGTCNGLRLFTSRILDYRFDRISDTAEVSWPERVEVAPALLDWSSE